MIKFNLNKTRSSVASNTALTDGKTKASTILTDLQTALGEKIQSAGPGLIIKIALNLILIACFPMGLKIYETREINKLKAQKNKEELLLNTAKQSLSALKAELDSYGYLKEKSEEFERKKEFLSRLAEKRLVIPRILDFIQDQLPNTVWLKRVDVDISDKENKRIEISGESFKEVGVNVFSGSLEQILDGNSITVNMRDVKEGESIVKVSFDLKGSM